MRYLAILLLLACFVSPSYASAVICSDGITYTDSATNTCPGHRTGLGVTNIASTTANVTGTIDAQGAGSTWYYYVSESSFPPGCTSANYTYAHLSDPVTATQQAAEKARQKCMLWPVMVAGTNSIAFGSVPAATAGSFSHQMSGGTITAASPYYVHEFHQGGTLPGVGKTSVMSTLSFTTLASGTPNEALTGLQRFIKDDGNNSNNGLTDATAKLTLAAGCPSSLAAGTDCNLKTGDTWTERMTVSHAGLSDDYSVVRCYKMDGGNPFACESGDTKPIIQGYLDQTELTAGTEDYRTAAFEADGLGTYGQYVAQYTVADTAHYSEHQNLSIKKARGRGINIQGTGTAGSLHHVKFTGVDTENTGFEPVVMESGVTQSFIKDGDFGFYNTCDMQRAEHGATNTLACAEGGWPGGISIKGTQLLVEGNTIHDGLGEGMNCYKNGSAFSIYRNNRVGRVWSSAMYTDICTDVVVEGNIFVGSRGDVGYIDTGAAEWGGGFSASWEEFNLPNAVNTERITVRNNLMVGSGTCLSGTAEAGAAAAGKIVEVKAFGNTCIDPVDLAMHFGDAATANNATFNGTNNVVWSDLSAAAVCNISASGTIETLLDNHWSTTPSDAQCVGTGDTSGAPGLSVSTYATWEAYTASSWPTMANADPQGGGAVIDTCTALTGALLTSASYGFAADNMDDVIAGTITRANWSLQNALDAAGVVRGGTCSKGVLE